MLSFHKDRNEIMFHGKRGNKVDEKDIYYIQFSVYYDVHQTIKIKFMYFEITTNNMQRFLIYLLTQTLYMFQAVPPPIIRST